MAVKPFVSKTTVAVTRELADVFERKNADYAGDLGTYSNFEYAAKVAEPFVDPVDKVFATMIGIKLARLAALKGRGRAPRNEPVEDSHKDLTTYAAIWTGWEIDREAREEEAAGFEDLRRAALDSRGRP